MKIAIAYKREEPHPLISIDHWFEEVDGDEGSVGQFVVSHVMSPGRTPVATIDQWFVEPGDRVEPGQPIVEVMSDGGIEVIEAPYYGRVLSRMVAVNDTVQPQQNICLITGGDDICSHRGGPRPRMRTSEQRHALVADLLKQGYKLKRAA